MKKIPKISNILHQVCIVHGIHLAVTDVLYQRKKCNGDVSKEAEVELSDDEDSEEVNDDDDGEVECFSEEPEVLDLVPSIAEIVKKVRKTVNVFLNSVSKTETLAKYIQEAKRKENGLCIDCKVRWNSMYKMLNRFYTLRVEVKKTLLDYKEEIEFSPVELEKVKEIVRALAPIKVAVEAMCRRSATLMTCDVSLGFALNITSKNKSNLGREIHNAFLKRVAERRSILSDIASYLNNRMWFKSKKTWGVQIATKTQAAQLIKKIYQTKKALPESEEQCVQDIEEDCSASSSELSLEIELNQAIASALATSGKTQMSDKSTTATVEREMSFYEAGEDKGKILGTVNDFLLTIPPSSVESERAFSCANLFCTRIRSRLSDKTLDSLVFLKQYFLSSE